MISENQRCKMVTLLKVLKNIYVLPCTTMTYGHFHFYKNYISTMIFSSIEGELVKSGE